MERSLLRQFGQIARAAMRSREDNLGLARRLDMVSGGLAFPLARRAGAQLGMPGVVGGLAALALHQRRSTGCMVSGRGLLKGEVRRQRGARRDGMHSVAR